MERKTVIMMMKDLMLLRTEFLGFAGLSCSHKKLSELELQKRILIIKPLWYLV